MKSLINGKYVEVVEEQLTQEQIALIEAKQKETTQMQIAELKQKLNDTDYQAIKFVEGWLTETEYAPIKAQRQLWRNEINELEEISKSEEVSE